jgi:hypothetical protein
VLWTAPKLFAKEHTWEGLVLIAAYLGSIVLGGVVGAIVGFVAARKINQRLCWTRAF